VLRNNRFSLLLATTLIAPISTILVARQASQATTPAERRQAWTDHVAMRDASEFRGMRWHALGPSQQGSRIEAIALSPTDPATMYVGPGGGNVWKTTNNGITWAPIFDHESAFSIGDIAIAPSDDSIVWVGTGEVQPRHSGPAFAGTGVFKSTDAGQTWTNQGLDDTHHIGKVLIHPTNPDVVYVAAMGHFRSANDERGVFKTTDGGRTWTRSLFVSSQTGTIDVVMDPSDPNTLLAWAWQLTVDGESGLESGLYKTTDAGATWKKVTAGLPAGPMGRAGLDIAPSQPSVVYAFVDNWAPVIGERDRPIAGGEVYRSDDRGETWRKVNTDDIYSVFGIFGWKFADVRVSPTDENELYILGNRMFRSADGGKTFARIGEAIRRVNNTPGETMHLDHHELVIDPRNPARLILGNDGGVFISHDRGATWLHLNNIPIGQFYFVTVDDEDPYRIYAGSQDTGALMGPSTYRYSADPVATDAWKYIWLDQWTGGDAFTTLPDPTDPRFIYYEHQNGAMRRIDMSMGNPYSGGPATQVVRPRVGNDESPVRFSWFTPYLISHHDPRTLYAAGNVVFKTTDRAATWRRISPDLGEPGSTERAMVPTGAVTTLSESRLTAGLLYAGTEGGKMHVTQDDGARWMDVSAGLAEGKWVTRVVASEHEAGVVYVAQSGYRADDFQPYLFRSGDHGATWQSISRGLPRQPVNVVIEDPTSSLVLYVGTDLGVYVSLDAGQSWQSLVADLPSTPVYDLVVHRREGELIAATHGRGLFLLDVRPVQSLAGARPAMTLTVFPVRPVRLTWKVRRQVPPQPPRGVAEIHYRVASGGQVQVFIRDSQGQAVRTLTGTAVVGVNVIEWDARNEEERDARPGMYQVEVRSGAAAATTTVELSAVRPRS